VAVLEKHRRNPRLGRWRLSLFQYEGQKLGSTTIWRILVAARKPRLPSQPIYHLTHYHQIWFIDHMHLRTLPDGQKVYSLVIVDGMSREILFAFITTPLYNSFNLEVREQRRNFQRTVGIS